MTAIGKMLTFLVLALSLGWFLSHRQRLCGPHQLARGSQAVSGRSDRDARRRGEVERRHSR